MKYDIPAAWSFSIWQYYSHYIPMISHDIVQSMWIFNPKILYPP